MLRRSWKGLDGWYWLSAGPPKRGRTGASPLALAGSPPQAGSLLLLVQAGALLESATSSVPPGDVADAFGDHGPVPSPARAPVPPDRVESEHGSSKDELPLRSARPMPSPLHAPVSPNREEGEDESSEDERPR